MKTILVRSYKNFDVKIIANQDVIIPAGQSYMTQEDVEKYSEYVYPVIMDDPQKDTVEEVIEEDSIQTDVVDDVESKTNPAFKF